MANGNAARLPFPATAPSAPPAAAPKPDSTGIETAIKTAAAPARAAAGPIETTIGAAVADAAILICQATLTHWQTGVLDSGLKNEGATRIARVAKLALDHELGDDDFAHKVRSAGKTVLRRYLTDDDLQRLGPAAAEAAIDLCLDHLLTIVGNVVRTERTLRAAWAH